MISCRKASEMSSRSLEQPLTRLEKINLYIHFFICRACKHAHRQMTLLRDITSSWFKRSLYEAAQSDEMGQDRRSRIREKLRDAS